MRWRGANPMLDAGLVVDDSARRQLDGLLNDEGRRALGLVLRGVAHEARNALNPTGLQLAILRRLLDTGQPVDEVVQGIQDALKRAMGTLDEVSDLGQEFAPAQDDDPALVGLWDRLRAERADP